MIHSLIHPTPFAFDSQMAYNIGMVKRICKRCNKEFGAFPSRVKKCGALYCSRDCSNKSTALRGEKSPHWVGDKVGYYGIHDWLYTNFGKATKCEECGSKKRVQWAKMKDKEYERRRESFWQLCYKCHMEYDGTSIKNQKVWNKGKKWSEEMKEKISIGTKIGMSKLKRNG